MKIEYKTKQLQQCAENMRFATKVLGAEMAKQYRLRIMAIAAAVNFESLRSMLGKFHELKYNRKGQWGAALTANYRLIISPKEKPFSDASGRIDWTRSTDAVVVEIIDYH